MTDTRFLSVGFAMATCRLDNIRERCRYLIEARLREGSSGHQCGKLWPISKAIIDAHVISGELSATADNCAGIPHEE